MGRDTTGITGMKGSEAVADEVSARIARERHEAWRSMMSVEERCQPWIYGIRAALEDRVLGNGIYARIDEAAFRRHILALLDRYEAEVR